MQTPTYPYFKDESMNKNVSCYVGLLVNVRHTDKQRN